MCLTAIPPPQQTYSRKASKDLPISGTLALQHWPDVGTDVQILNGPMKVQFHASVQMSNGLMWASCIGLTSWGQCQTDMQISNSSIWGSHDDMLI